jgi:hypothetical protein
MLDRFHTEASCGCEFPHGQWFPCDAHRSNPTDAPWNQADGVGSPHTHKEPEQ